MRESKHDQISVEEVIDWTEYAGWTTLVLYPILGWIYGSSVSNDQFIVRAALLVIALLSAFGVRTYKIVNAHRDVS